MNSNLFEIEPEEPAPAPLSRPTLEIEPEPEIEIEPEPARGMTPAQDRQVAEALRDIDAVMPLVEVLPADFPLPTLIKFIPNVALLHAAQQATAYALAVDVTGPEGIERADLALAALKESQKAILDEFVEPVEIANRLHKRLTGLRSEWSEPGEQATKTVGARVWAEKRRLDAIAAEERRKAQEAADAEARAAAKREADAAKKNQAPPQVVEELQRRVETATAPPVAPPIAAPAMKSNSVVTTWKARPKGTPADADPNPKIAEMSPGQLEAVREAMRAVLENRAPMTAFEVCWSVINSRAKADKQTFNIPGFEAFEEGSVRSKGVRRR
jgi:hypothetical protein